MRNVFWFAEDGVTKLAVKKEGGWRVEEGFRPYFFVRKQDVGLLPDFATPAEGGWEGPSGEEAVRVEVPLPSLVPKARPDVSFLADLPYYRRWTIDTGATFDREPRVLFYDVEASTEFGFPRPENPRGRVLSIASVDERGREYFICEKDERSIFEQFKELMKSYDFLVGFNSGRKPSQGGWDLPYLYSRAKREGFPFDWRMACWGDLMGMYERITQHRAGSLSTLSERVLGRKMEKPVARGWEVTRWFECDRSRLEEYNLEDCRVLREINERLRLVDIFCEVAHLAKVSYTDAQSVYCVVDNLAIEEAKKRRLVFYTGGEGEEEEKEGSVVFPSVPGLHRTYWYDFKSSYPSVIATFNISPETVSEDGVRTEVLSFRSDRKGVLPAVVERLMEERARSSGLRAEALKVIANSVYGATCFPGSRYYRKELAESVTKTQQSILMAAKRLAERRGARVLYGDTDSLAVDSPLPLDEINDELRSVLCYQYGVKPDSYRIRLDFKGESYTYFSSAKKRYVKYDAGGRVVEVKGFEVVRKNTPKIVAKVQKELFDLIGTCIGDPSKLEGKIKGFLVSLKAEFFSGKLDHLLAMRSGVEDLESYKAANAPHVKAARRLREMGYPPKEEVEYVISDVSSDGLKVEPVVDGRMPAITDRARRHYWENRVLPRIEAIVGKPSEALGTSLDRWFG